MSTILIGFEPWVITEDEVAQIGAAAPGYRVLITNNRDQIAEAMPDVEVSAGPMPYDLLVEAPRLRWHHGWGAGADWLMRHPEAVERDFIVTNTVGIHSVQMAEHTLMFLCAFARGLPDALAAQGRREWLHKENPEVFELAGKTLLLVGLGAIGRRIASLGAALEMNVIGIRRRSSEPVPVIERVYGVERLPDLLPEADFVVLIAPLTHETYHLMDERALRRMKPSAYLINISRGGLVDERALVRALREGWLAGAGLDVFEQEPLPSHSPLWDLPNVIITAHYGGVTPEYDRRATAIFIDNLKRLMAGDPLRNVVDKRLGY